MTDDVLLSLVIVSLVFLAVVVSGLLALYSRYQISHPISESYSLLMTADCLWAGSYLLMIIGAGSFLTEFGLVMKALMSTLAGVAWLLFVSEYTGDSEWIPQWVWWILTFEAVVFSILVALNPEGLVISAVTVEQLGAVTFAIETAGVITELQLLVSAGLVVTSLVLLGRFSLRTQTVYRYQALIIFLTGVVVVTSAILFTSGYRIHPLVDPTPILFNIQAIAVGWALYRYDFLKLAPVIVTRFFKEMNDPVLIIDPEFVIADYNKAAEQLIGGLTQSLAVDAIDEKQFASVLRTAISGTESDVEFAKETAGGTDVYDIEVTAVTDQFGLTQGYVVVLREITSRKRRGQKLREQNERLEEFADIISHDLRNPLTTADGWTRIIDEQLAEDDPDIEAARQRLRRVTGAHERMEELISMLLTVAREGQNIEQTDSISLTQCATEAWETAHTAGMALEIETDRRVETDPRRLKQAFENLFRNANEHGAATTVYLTELPDGFAVEDDGTGMSAAEQEAVFEFGYSTDEDGTGIGLAVVRRIIEAHGWDIEITDGAHGGTRFEITTVSTPSP